MHKLETMKLLYEILFKRANFNRVYTATAGNKTITVKWAKISKQAKGYEIQYSTSSKFTKKTTKTVKVGSYKTTTKTIKKLKSNKKYYVRVRAYKNVKGKTYCSKKWSSKKVVKVKKRKMLSQAR